MYFRYLFHCELFMTDVSKHNMAIFEIKAYDQGSRYQNKHIIKRFHVRDMACSD